MSLTGTSGPLRVRPADEADWGPVTAMLRSAGLPLAGLAPPGSGGGLVRLWVAEQDEEVVGVAGLERYGTAALLRSVAVRPDARGGGVGHRLVDAVLAQARCDCIHDIYLRTTTAEGFFPRFGFTPVTVEAVPAPVRSSAEFQGACPESAVTMRCGLEPEPPG